MHRMSTLIVYSFPGTIPEVSCKMVINCPSFGVTKIWIQNPMLSLINGNTLDNSLFDFPKDHLPCVNEEQ